MSEISIENKILNLKYIRQTFLIKESIFDFIQLINQTALQYIFKSADLYINLFFLIFQ